jgi:hypothetical protein
MFLCRVKPKEVSFILKKAHEVEARACSIPIKLVLERFT